MHLDRVAFVENCLVRSDMSVVVADFGLARGIEACLCLQSLDGSFSFV
jgi:hypothetical protein